MASEMSRHFRKRMTDSDSDSFHSACDEVDQMDLDQLEEDMNAMNSAPSDPVPYNPLESETIDKLALSKKLKYDDEDGWDDFDMEEPEAKSGNIASSSNSEAEWDQDWGDTQAKPKHRTKHAKSRILAKDIPSDSTEADDEPKSRKARTSESKDTAKEEPHVSLWGWTGLNDVVSAVVESGFGIPSAEEMARLSVAERRKILEDAQRLKEPEPSLSSDEANEPQSPVEPRGSGIGGIFSGIMTGGLDVLETLGKKTFETLTIKDDSSGERRKFFLSAVDNSSTNLSGMLKQIQLNSDASPASPNSPKKHIFGYGSVNQENPNTNFVTQFEKNEGMVHLEGLELLMDGRKNTSSPIFEEKLIEFVVEDISEVTTEDFAYELKICLQAVGLPYTADNVLRADEQLLANLARIQQEVDAGAEICADKMHEAAVQTLAKLTAHSIQALHKIAQLLVMADNITDTEAIFAFTFVLCRRLSFYAGQYANLLSLAESSKTIDNAVTNIFFECSNACHYVKKALSLLKPFYR